MSAKGVLINLPTGKGQRSAFQNKDAYENLVKYICREGKDNRDFITSVGYGVDNDQSLSDQIDMINMIQGIYNIESRGGRRAAHMQYSITEEEFGRYGCNMELVTEAFGEMGREIFKEGYQVVAGSHFTKPKGEGEENSGSFVHVHFAVSSINYENGKKYHKTKAEMLQLQEKFDHIQDVYQSRSPVSFNTADTFKNRDVQYKKFTETDR